MECLVIDISRLVVIYLEVKNVVVLGHKHVVCQRRNILKKKMLPRQQRGLLLLLLQPRLIRLVTLHTVCTTCVCVCVCVCVCRKVT